MSLSRLSTHYKFAVQLLNVCFFLGLRSGRGVSQDAYTFQIILEKEQVGQTPTVQQLLETSFLSCDLKFEEVGATGIYIQSSVNRVYTLWSP